MIHGVYRYGEARVAIRVRDIHGDAHVIEAVLDTGFNGSVTLPPTIIADLGLPWHSRGRAEMANGAIEAFNVHRAIIEWDSSARPILVEAADTEPLLGTALLYAHELNIEMVDGGAVTISAL